MYVRIKLQLLLSLGVVLVGGPAHGEPNPETALCNTLGYSVESKSWDGGGGLACVFPDGSFCSAWSFLYGECGTAWTTCEQNGGKITVSQGSCPLSSVRCARCTTAEGQTCYEVENPGCANSADGGLPPDEDGDGCSCRANRGGTPNLVWLAMLGFVLWGLVRSSARYRRGRR